MARPANFLLAIAVSAFFVATVCPADEWPTFRGPNGDGVSTDANVPAEWDPDTNVQWKAGIPGSGWSAPVVTQGRVYMTTAVPVEDSADIPAEPATQAPDEVEPPVPIHRFEIHCLDLASGRPLWKRVATEGRPRIPKHKDNTFATETPVTDGERIIAYFGMMGLFCYDLDGQLLWQKDLGSFPMQADWGTASSLAIHGGLVFVQIDNEEKSFLVAIDTTFGAERWRVDREEKTNWCSPIIWTNKARTELVVGGKTIRSYEPASGKLIWELNVGERSTSASPAGNEEMLIVGGRGMFAVRAGAAGNITPVKPDAEQKAAGNASTATPVTVVEWMSSEPAGVLWSKETGGPAMSSPLIYQGFVYICDRRGGIVTCYHAATGEQAYKERLPNAGEFWASPWAAGGKVYCQDAAGATYVLAPGPEFKVLATNRLEGRFWATSAVADGALLLRAADALYCVKNKASDAVRAVRADTAEPPIRR